MNHHVLTFVLCMLVPIVGHAEDAPAELAKQAGLILRRNCYRCHKGRGSESGYAFNVLDVVSMVEEGMILKEDHAHSEIYNAMFRGSMPPKNRPQLPRPSAEEVEIVRKWIDAGADPIPPTQSRPEVSLKDELSAMRDHLRELKEGQDRVNVRFFSLTHLHNDPTVDSEQLQLTRIAIAKTLNSLSWEKSLISPKPINKHQTLFAVDLSKLGWTRDHWNALVDRYPYALSYGSLDDDELADIDAEIEQLRGSDRSPVALRADWMVAVGSKPPLYYTLIFDLELPKLVARKVDDRDPSNPKQMTDQDLENFLGVDVARNIVEGTARRSGFTESGVSGQNRCVERHPTQSGGFYWKSYDFQSSNRTASLSEFPLGPKFSGNPFPDLAFDHNGGEIIFSLPNGLQGYLLVDGRGRRIDAGPIEIVADSLKTSGNEQIVAGVSCIACHRSGMIESPDDEVRRFSGAVGDARAHVRRIYPQDEDFRQLIHQDRQRFLRSLEQATKNFVGERSISELPEPVGEVSRRYHLEPMSLTTVAAELSVSADQLKSQLETNPRLRQLGLRILLREGGTIKRATWESPIVFPLMKQTARQFGYDPR